MIAPERLAARRRWEWPPHTARNIKWATQQPSYAGARPALIEAALKRAQARSSGNWFVLGASGDIRARHATPVLRPVMRRAADRLWRDDLAYAERRYRLRAG